MAATASTSSVQPRLAEDITVLERPGESGNSVIWRPSVVTFPPLKTKLKFTFFNMRKNYTTYESLKPFPCLSLEFITMSCFQTHQMSPLIEGMSITTSLLIGWQSFVGHHLPFPLYPLPLSFPPLPLFPSPSLHSDLLNGKVPRATWIQRLMKSYQTWKSALDRRFNLPVQCSKIIKLF